jgi:hypothetical protein
MLIDSTWRLQRLFAKILALSSKIVMIFNHLTYLLHGRNSPQTTVAMHNNGSSGIGCSPGFVFALVAFMAFIWYICGGMSGPKEPIEDVVARIKGT